jgi:hypothetical protein
MWRACEDVDDAVGRIDVNNDRAGRHEDSRTGLADALAERQVFAFLVNSVERFGGPSFDNRSSRNRANPRP